MNAQDLLNFRTLTVTVPVGTGFGSRISTLCTLLGVELFQISLVDSDVDGFYTDLARKIDRRERLLVVLDEYDVASGAARAAWSSVEQRLIDNHGVFPVLRRCIAPLG
jgi:hypothetical protein